MRVLQIGISSLVLVSLAGCSVVGSDRRIDYGAGAKQLPNLEVPPDLSVPGSDERYKLPQGDAGSVATFSDYSKGGVGQGSAGGEGLAGKGLAGSPGVPAGTWPGHQERGTGGGCD